MSHSPDDPIPVAEASEEILGDIGPQPSPGHSHRRDRVHAPLEPESGSEMTANKFELEILQQPEIGAEAGFEPVTVGRLPIVPAPVVRLRVRNPDGEEVEDGEGPFMFCSCALKDVSGASVESRRSDGQTTMDEDTQAEFSSLIGSTVRTSRQVTDLDGMPMSCFVFDDVSVRSRGRYRLEFTLAEARRPKSPKLAAALSEPFEVVDGRDYPGRPVEHVLPILSRHLHEQGVPMYVPPLVLQSSEPPPAGSNPFPEYQLREMSTRFPNP
ncbi:hypothetical protein OIO90_003145 [Microbotryomycetes sp. JL221]|nr:hypothetical protein OIO90_003145 [Microbotryomycetes sp. JL221]